jgi:uncharacterized phage-associated protein
MSTVSARDVADEIRRRLPGLGTKKLHKLLYYCQGHHLAVYDEPLFPEAISAWDMGPVVASLWREERSDVVPLGINLDLSERVLNTIGYVISRYGALSDTDLERDKALSEKDVDTWLAEAKERAQHRGKTDTVDELMRRLSRVATSVASRDSTLAHLA